MPEHSRWSPHKKTRAKLDAHIKRRAAERAGIQISRRDIKQAILEIKQGQAQLLEDQGNRGVYAVHMIDRTVHVVYDRRREALVTVLPPNHRPTTTPKLGDIMPGHVLEED